MARTGSPVNQQQPCAALAAPVPVFWPAYIAFEICAPAHNAWNADEELWEDVHDVMGAGHETTATTAATAIYAGGCTARGWLGAVAVLQG